MTIEAQSVPVRNTESKYQFASEDVDASIKLLKEGQNPGQGGYDKEGQARQAAAHLITQIEGKDKEFGSTVGSRAWEDEKGKWRFALKIGKRKPNPPKGETQK